jgi:hydroxymethylglutaryl-CoA lyase
MINSLPKTKIHEMFMRDGLKSLNRVYNLETTINNSNMTNSLPKINNSNMINSLPKIKIYEMFMRDGLQSLNRVYNLETKIKFMELLSECDFHCVEFGSTTSPKLLPQMANSYELFSSIKPNSNSKSNTKSNTKYTMLVPSYSHTQKVLESNINSFGLVCSVSDTFAQKNLKKTSRESVENVFNQINLITEKCPNPHIRVYLSCAFGSPWENFNKEYLKQLELYIGEFIECGKQKKLSADNFDIVISDTVGLSTMNRTNEILRMLWLSVEQENTKYLGMHIHSKDDKFLDLVAKCIQHDITKFDSSMGGIGGCPFAEDKAFGNISTVKLIDYLSLYVGYCDYSEVERFKEIEKKIMDLVIN